MCLGINTFTFWCGPTDPVAEARIHRKRRAVCATRPCGQGRCETTKIEIHKTNLECALESTVSLFGALTSPCRLGARVGWSLPGGKPRGGGANQAEVDNKGLKRTGRAISFAFNIIRAIRANELQGVKSFVMYGMSGQVTQPAERFAPQSRGRLCDITWHVTVPPERPVSPEILWPGIDKGRYEAAVANAVLGVEERGKPSSRRPDQLRLEPSDGARLHPPGWYDPAS